MRAPGYHAEERWLRLYRGYGHSITFYHLPYIFLPSLDLGLTAWLRIRGKQRPVEHSIVGPALTFRVSLHVQRGQEMFTYLGSLYFNLFQHNLIKKQKVCAT